MNTRIFRILGLGLVLGSMTAFTACRDRAVEADKQLSEVVGKVKATLPQDMGDGQKLTDCYYENRTLTYRNEIDAKRLASINLDTLKAHTLTALTDPTSTNKAVVRAICDVKGAIRYIYVNGSDSVAFTFTAADLEPKE